ncbi:MAG: tetratricopeptide repeat protein [Gammaproteobacteria bacterium]|nr:tetratricopeptide repeat protein [Gammaproteobacteria bacterium]
MNDMETIKELQQDLPLGSRVRITLTNGKEQEGVLQSIGLDHIGIKKDDGYRAKIKTVMLGASQVIPSLVSGAPSSEEASTASGVPPSQKPASEAPSPASTELEKSNLSSARKAAGRASSAPKDAKETLNQEVTDEPSPPPIPLEIERQLMQIEIGLGERIKNACLEITPPNFGALPLKDLTDSSFKKTWHKITKRYGYASSVNELDRKFGRTQQIAHQLRLLKEEYSSLPHLRPRLAHLYYLQGQPNDALAELEWEVKYFRGSLEDSTLLNAAAIASEKGAALKALWFLELCFSHGNPGRYPQAWLVLLGLALKTQNIAVLAKIEQALLGNPKLLFESIIYGLIALDKKDQAIQAIQQKGEDAPSVDLCHSLLQAMPRNLSPEYLQITNSVQVKPATAGTAEKPAGQLIGKIHRFWNDRNYGFIINSEGTQYFFHATAITDENLRRRLMTTADFPVSAEVAFELGIGIKGDDVATDIQLIRSPAQLYEQAVSYANRGDYPSAIRYIQQLLEKDAGYPNAQAFHDKLKQYNVLSYIPRGDNPYARAKRAELIEKDLEQAAQLYRKAMHSNDHRESAVKDLAMLLPRLERTTEAIELLERYRASAQDKTKIGNILLELYGKANDTDKLEALAQTNQNPRKKELLLLKAGYIHLKNNDFARAESIYRQILKLSSNNIGARRNLAYALFRQERNSEAEELLIETLNLSFDNQTYELLSQIRQAEETGAAGGIENIEFELTTETSYISTSGAISEFAQFHLEQANLALVVPAERLREGRYNG